MGVPCTPTSLVRSGRLSLLPELGTPTEPHTPFGVVRSSEVVSSALPVVVVVAISSSVSERS